MDNKDSTNVNINPLVNEAVIEAPLAEVWNAWSSGEGLRAWLAPHAEIDLRVGGLMRTNYNAAGQLDDAQTIVNTVLSFEPYRMISIKVVQTPLGFPFANAITRMWSVIYFAAVDANHTTVREVTLGFDTDVESQEMRAFFERGNAMTMNQLKEYFAGRK